MSPKKIFFIAGEASGDLQAAHLIRALKRLNPGLQMKGLGGPLMAREGVELTRDLTKEAVLGLTDVLKKYFLFRKIFHDALKDVESFKPDAIILVDYPGFNLRFAKKINRRFKVIYYISPQIWAWAGKRIHTIKKTIDHMLVFFKFETDVYERAGVPVTWIGHPFVEFLNSSKPTAELRSEFLGQGASSSKLVALLPGSRETEVRRMLPDMIATANLIHQKNPSTRFILAESDSLPKEYYQNVLIASKLSCPVQSIRNRSFDILSACDFAMVSSGTATLEATLAQTPFVIFYKTAGLTFFLGRRLIQIPYIGLVNVVAGRKIVPEFLQQEIHPATIAQEALYLLDHADLREKMIRELKEVRTKLGEPGSMERAAKKILNIIS